MRINRWLFSGRRRDGGSCRARPGGWRSVGSRHFECLEERTLLSVVPPFDYDKVSPLWFGAVDSLELETVSADSSSAQSVDDLIDGSSSDTNSDRWIVRLTRDAVSQIESVAQTAEFLNTGSVDFHLLRGLGLPGQVLVETRGVGAAQVEASLGRNPYIAYYNPDGPITGQDTTFVVDTLQDEDDGNYGPNDQSLREALSRASATPGPDVIQFGGSLAGGEIVLQGALGELVVDSDVDIQGLGAGQLTIDAAYSGRVFFVSAGVTASLSGLTISGGDEDEGGGIRNEGILSIADSIISDNTASKYGGGISNIGTLEIAGSTISNNYAQDAGGGIDDDGSYPSAGPVTITNSTISGNTSKYGGGLNFYYAQTATLTNVTVSQNSAEAEAGGIYNLGTTVQLGNTIVAGNIGPVGADLDTYGSFTSLGKNLIQVPGTSTGWIATDLSGVDPLLGPLQDNGGPTPTHSLLAGSPAIDGGSDVLAAGLMYDQRGANRFIEGDDAVDIGAYEWQWSLPDDTDFDKLWGLHNTGQGGGTPDADIDAPQAWEISTGSSDVVVAVIDTGIDLDHPDLADNLWVNSAEAGGTAGFDDDGNGFNDDIYGYNFVDGGTTPDDDNGHGTHVAGIIGAVANDAHGVTGVSPSVSIMAVKFLDENKVGDSSGAISAINYVSLMRQQYVATGGVVGANVRVINASWVAQGTLDENLEVALNTARESDILIVAAAGNGTALHRAVDIDESPVYPASYESPGEPDNIISVTAMDRDGRLVPSYNFGDQSVDLAAPGREIYSTWLDDGHAYRDGTSMATPYVAGTAALVFANAPYELTAQEVRNAILTGVDPLDADDLGMVATDGRLNAYKALTADETAPRAEVISPSDITHHTGGTSYQFVVRYSDDKAVSRSSLDDADVKAVLLDESGEVQLQLDATLVSQSPGSTDIPVIEATYQISAPGGTWDHGDNGTYRVILQEGQVLDTAGHFARPLDLSETDRIGAFDCAYGVFFVDSPADSVDSEDEDPGDGYAVDSAGRCTLRAAVMEANALAGDNTIVLGSGEYTLTRFASGEDAAAWGDLDVTSPELLRIVGNPDGTTIRNTYNDRIFHVFAGATLELEDLDLRDGATFSPAVDDGAGIYNSGTLKTTNVSIEGCYADGDGGGIWSDGSVWLENTSVSSNTAVDYGGGIATWGPLGSLSVSNGCTIDGNQAAVGGGISTNVSTIISGDVTISGNTATSTGGGIFAETGGAAIDITIENGCSIVDNASGELGGGIRGHWVNLTVEECTISGNSSGEGGGIRINNGTMTLRNVAITENQAAWWGGGAYVGFLDSLTIEDCEISRNQAGGAGGGMFAAVAAGAISDSTISDNSAGYEGGGISNGGPLSVTRCIVSGNVSDSHGGGIANGGPSFYLTESTVSDNRAAEKGGGIHNSSWGIASIARSTLSGNSATTGGGLHNDDGGELSVSNSTFSGNSADREGGGIFNVSLVASLSDSTVTLNSSRKALGGGVYSTGVIEVQNTIIAENSAELGDPDCAGGGFRSLGNNLIGVGQTHVVYKPLQTYAKVAGPTDCLVADISADGSTMVGTFVAEYLDGSSPPNASYCDHAFSWSLDGGFSSLGSSVYDYRAFAVSSDGSAFVGEREFVLGDPEAFRWRNGTTTMLGDLTGGDVYSSARATAQQGSVVVGESDSALGTEAFRWVSYTGIVGLGDLPGGSFHSTANGVSADSTVIVGESDSTAGLQAFRCEYNISNNTSTMVGLGDLAGGAFASSAKAVSPDGLVMVGYGTSALGTEAFRLVNGGSMVGLGFVDAAHDWSVANDLSADGSILVGYSGGYKDDPTALAFIWDAENGMRDLQQLLADNYDVIDTSGAAIDISGLHMISVAGISDSGTAMAGTRDGLSGTTASWMLSRFPRPDGFADGVNGDMVGTEAAPIDPMLGTLENNTFSTDPDADPPETHVPQLGSPAIDAGNTADAPITDQRGVVRPQDGDRDGSEIADIGAVERYYGRIEGVKFHDLDNDGGRDLDEPGLPGWTIFADLNSNGALDAGEPSAITDEDGNYVLKPLPPGNYSIIEVAKPGWEQTFPSTTHPGSGLPGREFQVNTETSYYQKSPAIAMDDSGNYVVAWNSWLQDGSGYGVYAQMYHADGTPNGGEFQVNSHTTGSQTSASVAMNGSSGAFVITWISSGQDGSSNGIYGQRFHADGTPDGAEFPVNTYTTGNQSSPSVAMDDAGRFVVAWYSDAQDGDGYGIYAQRYNVDGTPAGTEFRVNTYTADDQFAPSVAIDDSGRFVITWYGYGQDGSGYGVFAQRYLADGTPDGTEFSINTYTANNQFRPSIAMAASGSFVITWQSYGQDGSADGIYAQRYDAAGLPAGAEFRVNTWTSSYQAYPAVAMDDSGNFVIAWMSFLQDGSRYGVYAQAFDSGGAPSGTEFLVNTHTDEDQYYPSIAMDAGGRFAIAWQGEDQDGSESGIFARQLSGFSEAGLHADHAFHPGPEFQVNTETASSQSKPALAIDNAGRYVAAWHSMDQDGDSYGIYAQRYNPDGTPNGAEFLVNSHTASPQMYPSVAINALTGDFVIAWQSSGQDGDGYGVYAQRYDADGTPDGPEFRVNAYTAGSQSAAAVAMDDTGNFIIVWSSYAQYGDNYGIFGQRYDADGTPNGTEFRINTYTTGSQSSADVAYDESGRFIVVWRSDGQDGDDDGIYAQRYDADGTPLGTEFRANTYTTNDQSAPALGVDPSGRFAIVWESYGQDGSTEGVYTQVFDEDGNPDGDEFRVNTRTTSYQSAPDVGMDAQGNFVVAWRSYRQDGSGYGIFAQAFTPGGVPRGTELQVNTYTDSHQQYPAIAMNAEGEFVVAWESSGQDEDSYGVFAKQFSAYHHTGINPLPEFLVNSETASFQVYPSVAGDSSGKSVVAWASYNQDGDSYGVFAQMYDADGTPNGDEFQVNTHTTGTQSSPDVAASAVSGAFVICWTSTDQDGDGSGVFAQRFHPDGSPDGTEFQVNTYTTGAQSAPAVAMDDSGRFVVVWQSDGQDGSYYGVYGQKYNADGTPDGGEFAVNTFTELHQWYPSVAMDAAGDFLVAWSSYGQDADGFGVYAQRYSSDGTADGPEFRVNTWTADDQFGPTVATDDEGNFVVAWTSGDQDGSGNGIFAQRYQADGTVEGTEFRVNTYTDSTQQRPSAAMNASGDFVITWESFDRDGEDIGVCGQAFDADGSPRGMEFILNTYVFGSQSRSDVVIDDSGCFTAVWQSDDQDGSNTGVFANRFNQSQENGIHHRAVGIAETVRNVDFGNHAVAGVIEGQVFNDLDNDRVKDGDAEAGLPGWTVFLDLNKNGMYDPDPLPPDEPEPLAEIDSQGNYRFVVPPGDYIVDQYGPGWDETTPTTDLDILDVDFDTSEGGFSSSGEWHRSDLEKAGGSGLSFYYGAEEPDQGGRYPNDVGGILTTSVDLAAHTGKIELEFKHLLHFQSSDLAQVSVVSAEGIEVLADNQDIGGLVAATDDIFQTVKLDLSAYAGQEVDIRFSVKPNPGAKRTESLSYQVTKDQEYFLRVNGFPTAGSGPSTNRMYDLTILGPGIPLDDFEASGGNDDPASATLLDQLAGTPPELQPSSGWPEAGLTLHRNEATSTANDDWYKFVAPSSLLINAHLLFRHDLGDLDFYLYDSDVNQLANSISTTDNEAISFGSLEAGKEYYLLVKGYDDHDANPSYDLRLFTHDVQRDGYDPPLPADPNDTFALATDLGPVVDHEEPDRTIHLNDNGTNDVDFYRFVAGQSGRYGVHLLFRDGLGDLNLYLYDINGKQLAESRSDDDNESVYVEVPVGVPAEERTYYVCVQGQTQYNYDLVIDGGAIREDAIDAAAGNDSFDNPTELGRLGLRSLADLTIDASDDQDFFRFVADADGTVEIDLRFDQSERGIDLFLYDSARVLRACSEGWFVDDVKVRSLGRYDVRAVAGEVYDGRDFGVRQQVFGTSTQYTGRISGYVFEDLNKNQAWDYVDTNPNGRWDWDLPSGPEGPEMGLANVTVQLFVDENPTGITTTTDENGYYFFEGLAPRTSESPYQVRLEGWQAAAGLPPEQTFPLENVYTEHTVRGGMSDPQSVAFGDFDADGDYDMAVIDFGSDTLSIWKNSGSVTDPAFGDQPTQTFQLDSHSDPIAVLSADFDGQNGDDLVIVNHTTCNVWIMRSIANNPSSNELFSLDPHYKQVVEELGVWTKSATTGLFNDDNLLDLAVVSESSDDLRILLNTGDPDNLFTEHLRIEDVGEAPYSVATGHFNSDDNLDLVVACMGWNDLGSVRIVEGNGSGGFTKGWSLPGTVDKRRRLQCGHGILQR